MKTVRPRALAALLAAALAGCAGLQEPGADAAADPPAAVPASPATAAPGAAPSAAPAPAPAPAAAAPAPAPKPPEASEGRRRLERGLAQYEQGRWAEAIRTLKDAPELAGEPLESRVRALKTVAFSQCLLEQRTACRRSFDALLSLDPAFRLAPAEAGHPSWGPVFTAARAAAPKARAAAPAASRSRAPTAPAAAAQAKKRADAR